MWLVGVVHSLFRSAEEEIPSGIFENERIKFLEGVKNRRLLDNTGIGIRIMV